MEKNGGAGMRRSSLRVKLTCTILAVFAVSIAIIFASMSWIAGNVLNADLDAELVLKGAANSGALEDLVSDMVSAIDSFTHDLELSTSMSMDVVSRAIDGKAGALPSASSVTAFYVGVGRDNYFHEAAGWVPPSDFVVANRAWYQGAVGRREPHIVTYEDANTGTYAISVSKGIALDTGDDAVIGVDMEITSALKHINVASETGYFFVEDATGLIISHRNPAFIPGDALTYTKSVSRDYQALAAAKSGSIVVARDYDGRMYHFSVSAAPSGGFRVYTAVRSDIVGGKVLSVILYCAAVALALMALTAAFFVVWCKRIVSPIRALTEISSGVAAGDMGVDVGIEGNDEIGVLSDTFREMVDSVREQARAITGISEGDYSQRLALRSERDAINGAINYLAQSSERMIGGIREASGQVMSASQHLAGASQSLAAGSMRQSGTLDRLSRQMEDMRNGNDRAGEFMSGCTEFMRRLAETMGNIEKSSNDVRGIISVIDGIAFQTNILALNASVEAARAGVHGKGFAVVAEEVRSLATRSAGAAKETSALIGKSIGYMKEGIAIAGDTGKSLAGVRGIVESNGSAIAKFFEKDALDEDSGLLVELNVIARANAEMAGEISSAAEELASQSAALQDIVSSVGGAGSGGAGGYGAGGNSAGAGMGGVPYGFAAADVADFGASASLGAAGRAIGGAGGAGGAYGAAGAPYGA
ncbi:MAG: methyl-accepting chemotaxis protein, partial [Clostridiales bacterium]|nr:methyl-accepting chemotaxis protein [Clostridiales bacterium]